MFVELRRSGPGTTRLRRGWTLQRRQVGRQESRRVAWRPDLTVSSDAVGRTTPRAAALHGCSTGTGNEVAFALMSTPKMEYPTLGIRIEGDNFTVLLNIAQVGPTMVA